MLRHTSSILMLVVFLGLFFVSQKTYAEPWYGGVPVEFSSSTKASGTDVSINNTADALQKRKSDINFWIQVGLVLTMLLMVVTPLAWWLFHRKRAEVEQWVEDWYREHLVDPWLKSQVVKNTFVINPHMISNALQDAKKHFGCAFKPPEGQEVLTVWGLTELILKELKNQ